MTASQQPDGDPTESSGSTDPRSLTDEERRTLHDLGERIVRFRMTTPALLLLESTGPLHFLASQAMVAFAPMLWLVGHDQMWNVLAATLEKPDAVPTLVAAIEEAATRDSTEAE